MTIYLIIPFSDTDNDSEYSTASDSDDLQDGVAIHIL